MSSEILSWGGDIAREEIGGVPFEVYTQRPYRVESLLSYAKRWGDRPHIIQGERVVTFNELRSMSASKAQELSALGIKQGDHVLLLGWNSADWIANFWAALEVGAVPVLGNAWWSDSELLDALTLLRPAITLADARAQGRMPEGWRCGPWEPASDWRDTPLSNEHLFASDDENAPAAVIFTSGTSGRAKAVVLSHRALLAGLQKLLHVTRRMPHQIDESFTDVGLHTGPLFHIGGIQTLLRAVTVGGTLIMPSAKFDPGEALELIERYQVSRWSAVPTMISRLLEHPDVHKRDLSSLRSLTLGGAPVYSELLKRVRDGLPGVQPRIATGYGLSENGGQATAASGKETIERPGASGRALPCVEVKIAARPGFPDGEILIRAPTQMSGYYGSEESPIDQNGWLHTGDLGYLDDDGYLWITGRCKDVIIRGGENISPVAVEEALGEIPGVAEAAVFGVPHPDLGEEVMAVVVVSGVLTAEQIQQSLKQKIASFSVPSRWRIQSTPLPTNPSGKVDKPLLIQQEREDRQSAVEGVAL